MRMNKIGAINAGDWRKLMIKAIKNGLVERVKRKEELEKQLKPLRESLFSFMHRARIKVLTQELAQVRLAIRRDVDYVALLEQDNGTASKL